jgi:hypothetical protein
MGGGVTGGGAVCCGCAGVCAHTPAVNARMMKNARKVFTVTFSMIQVGYVCHFGMLANGGDPR